MRKLILAACVVLFSSIAMAETYWSFGISLPVYTEVVYAQPRHPVYIQDCYREQVYVPRVVVVQRPQYVPYHHRQYRHDEHHSSDRYRRDNDYRHDRGYRY